MSNSLTLNIGYLRTNEGMVVAGEIVSTRTFFRRKFDIIIALQSLKEITTYILIFTIHLIFEVMAFIGMCVNIVSGGLAGILLWIVFWLTIIVSGMIFLFSLCNAYNTMLNKFSILIWLVRSRILDIKYTFIVSEN